MKLINLKLITFTLLFGMLINPIFSQTKTKILCYSVDDFDDSKKLRGGSSIMYTDGGDLKTEGLVFQNSVKEKKGKVKDLSIILSVFDKTITCVDNGSTLDILFEDGSKIKLVNWNDFDCEGVNYFDLTESQTNDLKTKKLKGLRYTEKRNYKTITIKENLSEENKTFYMNVLKEMDDVNNGNSTISICKKEE